MLLELGLAVGGVPKEGDKNQNHSEHGNLGLGRIQWYSVSLISKVGYGGWCHGCADIISTQYCESQICSSKWVTMKGRHQKEDWQAGSFIKIHDGD